MCASVHAYIVVCVFVPLCPAGVGGPEGGVGSRSLVRMSSCLTQPTGTDKLTGDLLTLGLIDVNAVDIMISCSGSPRHFHTLVTIQ